MHQLVKYQSWLRGISMRDNNVARCSTCGARIKVAELVSQRSASHTPPHLSFPINYKNKASFLYELANTSSDNKALRFLLTIRTCKHLVTYLGKFIYCRMLQSTAYYQNIVKLL